MLVVSTTASPMNLRRQSDVLQVAVGLEQDVGDLIAAVCQDRFVDRDLLLGVDARAVVARAAAEAKLKGRAGRFNPMLTVVQVIASVIDAGHSIGRPDSSMLLV
jgi:hypothetical protein